MMLMVKLFPPKKIHKKKTTKKRTTKEKWWKPARGRCRGWGVPRHHRHHGGHRHCPRCGATGGLLAVYVYIDRGWTDACEKITPRAPIEACSGRHGQKKVSFLNYNMTL